jgi:hypothetical protein
VAKIEVPRGSATRFGLYQVGGAAISMWRHISLAWYLIVASGLVAA